MKKYFLRSLGVFFLVLAVGLTACGNEARAFQVVNGRGTLILLLRLPQGYEFTHGAPFTIEARSAAPDIVSFPQLLPRHFDPAAGHYGIPFTTHTGTALVTIKAGLFYCDKNSKMCFQDTRETRLTFDAGPKGPATVLYLWEIAPKKDDGPRTAVLP